MIRIKLIRLIILGFKISSSIFETKITLYNSVLSGVSPRISKLRNSHLEKNHSHFQWSAELQYNWK